MAKKKTQPRHGAGTPEGGQFAEKEVSDSLPKTVRKAVKLSKDATKARVALYNATSKNSPAETIQKLKQSYVSLNQAAKDARAEAKALGYSVKPGGKYEKPDGGLEGRASELEKSIKGRMESMLSGKLGKKEVDTLLEQQNKELDIYKEVQVAIAERDLSERRSQKGGSAYDSLAEAQDELNDKFQDVLNKDYDAHQKKTMDAQFAKIKARATLEVVRAEVVRDYAVDEQGILTPAGELAAGHYRSINIYPKDDKPVSKVVERDPSTPNSDIAIETKSGEKVVFKGIDNDNSSKTLGSTGNYDEFTEWLKGQPNNDLSDAIYEYKFENHWSMNSYLRWKDMGHTDHEIDDYMAQKTDKDSLPNIGYIQGVGKNPWHPQFLERIKKKIDDLITVSNHTPLAQNTVLNRGVGSKDDPLYKALSLLEPGDDLPTDAGFVSTSVTENGVTNAVTPIASIKILAPAGTKGAYLNADPDPRSSEKFTGEQEFLLSPHTRFRLLEKQVDAYGKITAIVGIIGQGKEVGDWTSPRALKVRSLWLL